MPHPDLDALRAHLTIHPPQIREDLSVELALTEAGALGCVWIEEHDVQIWLHGGAERDERTVVLAAAHDALSDPRRWNCWRDMREGSWLLWIYVETMPADQVPANAIAL